MGWLGEKERIVRFCKISHQGHHMIVLRSQNCQVTSTTDAEPHHPNCRLRCCSVVASNVASRSAECMMTAEHHCPAPIRPHPRPLPTCACMHILPALPKHLPSPHTHPRMFSPPHLSCMPLLALATCSLCVCMDMHSQPRMGPHWHPHPPFLCACMSRTCSACMHTFIQ